MKKLHNKYYLILFILLQCSNTFYANNLFADNSEIRKLFNSLQSNKKSEQLLSKYQWQALGPYGISQNSSNQYDGNGRINIVIADPTNENILYIGAATSGIWKSINKGKTWQELPHTNFMSLGISALAIPPFANNIIYAALGDIGKWVYGSPSVGIIKSTDFGNTWTIITDTLKLDDKILFSKLLLDPIDPQILLAASSIGLSITYDGGENWENLIKEEFIRDIEFQPYDVNTIYASTYNYYGNTLLLYSKNSGQKWDTLAKFNNIVRTAIAVCPAKPERLYFMTVKTGKYNLGGIYYTDDFGETIIQIDTLENEDEDIVGNQGFYNLVLEVNPEDENEIFAGGVPLYQTKNLGMEWNRITNIHVDQHSFLFTKSNSRYVTNDGGIYTNIPPATQWKNISDSLNITQVYDVSQNPRKDDFFIFGAQDNGNKLYLDSIYHTLTNADGMKSVFDTKNNAILYLSIAKGKVYRSENFGFRPLEYISGFAESLPSNPIIEIAINPYNNFLYLCYDDVYKSENNGNDFENITDIEEKKEGIISTITFKSADTLFFANDSAIYEFVNYEFSKNKYSQIHQAFGKISDLLYSQNKLYFSYGGYKKNQKLFIRYKDSITNISKNLPNIPVNCISYIDEIDMLLVGTDAGLYASSLLDLENINWKSFGTGLPNLIITDIDYKKTYHSILVSTYGRGVYKLKLSDNNIEKPILNIEGNITICKNDTLLLEITNKNTEYNYIWQNGSKTENQNIFGKGGYYVSANDNQGNSAASNILWINENILPKVNIFLESNNPVCSGRSCILKCNVSNFDIKNCKIRWSNGDTTQKVYLKKSGIYYVSITSPNDCIGKSENFEVIVYPETTIPIINKEGNFLISTKSYRYQWYKDNNIIKGAVGQTFYIDDIGNYTVCTIDSNFCKNCSQVYQINISAVDIIISPNPVDALCYIDVFCTEKTEVQIYLYDIKGKLVYEYKEGNITGLFSRKFNFENLASGVYILNIFRNEKKSHTKLLKN